MAMKPNAILDSLRMELEWKIWLIFLRDWSNHVDLKFNWLYATFALMYRCQNHTSEKKVAMWIMEKCKSWKFQEMCVPNKPMATF